MVPIHMFIENFKKGFDEEYLVEVFTQGNCYHFALMLNSMYGGDIVYDPHELHFSLNINGKYYDISGEIPKPMDEYLWEEMEDIDYEEYVLVKNNCVYKV